MFKGTFISLQHVYKQFKLETVIIEFDSIIYSSSNSARLTLSRIQVFYKSDLNNSQIIRLFYTLNTNGTKINLKIKYEIF